MDYSIQHNRVRIGLLAVFCLCVVLWGMWYVSKPLGTQSVAQQKSSDPVATSTSTKVSLVPLHTYIEVVDSCGPYYEGAVCVNMRSGPGTEYRVAAQLRTGVVLRVADTVTAGGRQWYKIMFATALAYPERVTGDLYVAAGTSVRPFLDDGDHTLMKGKNVSTTKRIVVDVSREMLYAYEGDALFMQEPISTGLEFTPTPRGTFVIFKMTPARYMQGPIPGVSEQVYDLPGVPWDLYFTQDGAVIHGAYWHDHFGEPWSHGCVNLSPENAKKLYMWAEIGIPVTVQN